MDSIMQVFTKIRDRVIGTEHTVSINYRQGCGEDWYEAVCSCGHFDKVGASHHTLYENWREHLKAESKRQHYYAEEGGE
jgi:hypothetical protein